MTATNIEHARGGVFRAIWAAILSLVLPGLGQILARRWRRGLILIGAETLLYAVFRTFTGAMAPTPINVAIILGVIAIGLALGLGAAIDAARLAHFHPIAMRPRWFRSTWFVALVAIAIAETFVFALPMKWRSFSTPSTSNAPNLMVGDVFMADLGASARRGDLLLFTLPRDPETNYIKRLIGLPGDRIQLVGGELYINGKKIDRRPKGEMDFDLAGQTLQATRFVETLPDGRAYEIIKTSTEAFTNDTAEMTVPQDSMFFLGDNRDNSLDSRFKDVGFIPFKNLVGKAATIYWSPDRARVLTRLD